MQMSVTEAKGQLTDLIRRAEAGDEVILTRHGQAVVRLTPVHVPTTAATRRNVIAQVQAKAKDKALTGASAARSQDFLYNEDGLPQ